MEAIKRIVLDDNGNKNCLVGLPICQVGGCGHMSGWSTGTSKRWILWPGHISALRRDRHLEKYKNTKYCFSTLIIMSWEICRLVFLLQFICFWNNLLHAGLVQRREIENVSSLQFSSSFMAWGEGRLRTGRADKWELPAPSLVQGISTFRRGEALVSWYCSFLGAEGR